MNEWLALGGAGASAIAASTAGAYYLARKKGLHRWLWTYLAETGRRSDPKPNEKIHLIFAVCDHYEPKLGNAAMPQARERVKRWADDYPRLFCQFCDSDGVKPQHSYFFPIEEYEPEFLDSIANLCHQGLGETEIHLHHDNDTADNLRKSLNEFKNLLAEKHNLLSRHKKTNELMYGFIHGNWSLDNSRCDRKWCGVDNELDILRETGCYADFTLPSSPSETQTKTINKIYYATEDGKPKSHNTGVELGTSHQPNESLMLIQGPLCFDWSRRKAGIIPCVENACLQGSQPPSAQRLKLWLRCRVSVPKRPDWIFVKLHTHGANEFNMPVLLGEPMVKFHELLRQKASENPNFKYHYVSAREMYNLAKAAESGFKGSVAEARDWELEKNWHN